MMGTVLNPDLATPWAARHASGAGVGATSLA
jgi:hypothetical protein